ncbi:ATP-binding protein [Streptomyces sp. RKAG293]|uniref:ATP-binding protein n=1 Tax=Streptomyces sp. RKAG293 TaxID=2893403 RepID=UPI0020348D3F|nr:ATP-binding protein [Streptomyces sp. RKAG293]MCM2420215.1 ATP-binding protein [Streptomyces sp. RKAG293]
MNDATEGCGSPDQELLGAMTLYPLAESVPRARRWFLKFIEPHGIACPLDDCLLMISELVTNAILYGRAEEPWLVRVEWSRVGTRLRVDVHNAGLPACVRMRRPAADVAHGRGLCLVNALADSWHVGPSLFGGTVVSFVVADAWQS